VETPPPNYQPPPGYRPPHYEPPPYAPGADIPPESPYHRSGVPGRRNRSGLMGWLTSAGVAVFGVLKYGLILLKIPAFATFATLLVSFGAYAVFYGPWFALGLVVMILLHEMGHVIEIRRQGMKATAPLFIPFMGAAIFQRSHPRDALKQAEIGIAGPIAGTIAATAAFVLYGSTQQPLFLLWAYLGFWINLFNMLPIGFLDGGWIMAAVSKWFQVVGMGLLALAVVFFHFVVSPFLIVIVLLMIPTVIARFRYDGLPYYQSVPVPARLAMGVAWLGLSGYLAFASLQANNLLQHFVR
jgi:Zn-dependent protease